MGLFWREGYAASTPQRLADEIGIAKGSMYGAFGGKRELFGLALRAYGHHHGDDLAQLLVTPGPALERIGAALTAIIEANARGTERRGCLAVNTAAELGGSDEAAAEEVMRQFERGRAQIERAIARGQREGDIRDDLPAAELAAQIHAIGVGLQVLARVEREPLALRSIVRASLAQLAPPAD